MAGHCGDAWQNIIHGAVKNATNARAECYVARTTGVVTCDFARQFWRRGVWGPQGTAGAPRPVHSSRCGDLEGGLIARSGAVLRNDAVLVGSLRFGGILKYVDQLLARVHVQFAVEPLHVSTRRVFRDVELLGYGRDGVAFEE